VLCTDTTANALLNLPGATYNLTAINSPTFTADRGYTGASTKDLDTGFNPTTAGSPHYLRNDGMAGVWSLASAQNSGGAFGQNLDNVVYPRYIDDKIYYAINQSTQSSVANTDGSKLIAAQRTGASATEAFKSGVSIGTDTIASVALVNSTFLILKGDGAFYTTGPVMFAFLGSHITSGQHLSLYNRLLAFAQAVGAQ
jgi:hypothetical protein